MVENWWIVILGTVGVIGFKWLCISFSAWTLGTTAGVSVLTGGYLADRWAHRHPGGRMATQAMGLLVGVPFLFSARELARFLVERGYRVMVSEWFPIERYGASHTWRRFTPYPCELADPRAWGNLIAVEPALEAALARACSRVTADLDEK